MNWGIMGTGTIAHLFAEALNYDNNAVLYACASRTEAKAEAFRQTFGVRKAYGSYEAMAADPEVNIAGRRSRLSGVARATCPD